MTKTIDGPHAEALNMLDDRRVEVEVTLTDIKAAIRTAQYYLSKTPKSYTYAVELLTGDISHLAKVQNGLRVQLQSVEDSRKALKADRTRQQQEAWEDEQYRLECEAASQMTYMPCGCW